MMQDFSWPQMVLGLAALILLGFLILSEAPQTRRLNAVNEVLTQVEVDPSRFTRLRDQVAWIVRNSDLGETAHMSQEIALDRLDVVVSDARFAEITKTGRANAIYDPELKAVFIDSYLLDPVDLPFIGTDGPTAAFSEADFGFWNTSLSFVIAHELGHHSAGDNASAFFSSNWLSQKPIKVDREVAADAYALDTLARAYSDPDMPDVLVEQNALFFFGLDFNDLVGAERAAGDLIGAMKAMTLMMQFSSGSYSPFYQDAAHPSFLARVLLALDGVSLAPDSVVLGQSPVLVEETRRQLKAAERRFLEIQAPGPIARVAAHEGRVLLAVRNLIHTQEDDGLSKIYRMHLPEMPKDPTFELIATEETPAGIGESHNAWIETQLEALAPGIGTLGLAGEVGIVPQLRLFEPFERFQTDGLAFVDDGWALPSFSSNYVATREAISTVAQTYFDQLDIELGLPIANEDALIFPVFLQQSRTFRVVSVRASSGDKKVRELVLLDAGTPETLHEPELLVDKPPMRFYGEFTLENGWIDIEGARWTGEEWIVPGRASGGETPYVWELHTGGGGQPWVTQSRERLMADFIAETGEASFGRDLDPTGPSLMVLNPDAALVWYDQDTVWLSTPHDTVPIFHPAFAQLRITPIDATRALFWVSNATKAYLIDILD